MSADTDGRFWSMTANDDGTVTAAFDAHEFTTTPRREDEIADAARPVHYREAAASLRDLIAAAIPSAHSEDYIDGINYAADLLDSTAQDLEGDTE